MTSDLLTLEQNMISLSEVVNLVFDRAVPEYFPIVDLNIFLLHCCLVKIGIR